MNRPVAVPGVQFALMADDVNDVRPSEVIAVRVGLTGLVDALPSGFDAVAAVHHRLGRHRRSDRSLYAQVARVGGADRTFAQNRKERATTTEDAARAILRRFTVVAMLEFLVRCFPPGPRLNAPGATTSPILTRRCVEFQLARWISHRKPALSAWSMPYAPSEEFVQGSFAARRTHSLNDGPQGWRFIDGNRHLPRATLEPIAGDSGMSWITRLAVSQAAHTIAASEPALIRSGCRCRTLVRKLFDLDRERHLLQESSIVLNWRPASRPAMHGHGQGVTWDAVALVPGAAHGRGAAPGLGRAIAIIFRVGV